MKKTLVLSTMIALMSGLTAQAVVVYSDDFSTTTITTESSSGVVFGGNSPDIATNQWFSAANGVDINNALQLTNFADNRSRGAGIWLDSSAWSNGTVTVTFDVLDYATGGVDSESFFQAYYAMGVDGENSVSIDVHGGGALDPVTATTGSATIGTIGARNMITANATQATFAFSFTGQEHIALIFHNMSAASGAMPVYSIDNLSVTSEAGAIPANLVTPADLAISHVSGTDSSTGTVDAVVVSDTTMDVAITISDQSHAGAFTVLSATPQTLTNETTELAFKFDNTVANLVVGETATGLVAFAWTETGGGASGTNFMAVSATVVHPATPVYVWNGSGNDDWTNDSNWEGEFGQSVDPVFDNTAIVKMAGTNNLDQYIRIHSTVKSFQFMSSNTENYALRLVAFNGADRDLTFSSDSGNATLTIDALASGDKTFGANLAGELSPGEVVLESDLDITHNGAGDLIFAAEIRGDGDLNIAGSGVTVLSGMKTFTIGGDGTNNVIAGSGTVNFDGNFSFDLTSAGTTFGDSWTIVDVDNLTETFGAGFTVDNFTDAGSDTWTNGIDGTVYQFSEISGVLSVIQSSASYQDWISGFGLTGDNALPETDVEPDGLNNLMEYALGGNPTIDDAATVSPKTYTADDGGTDYFYHVSGQRDGDPSLTFTLGTKTSLTASPTWDTGDVSYVGESVVTDHYKTVTNRTEATPSVKFIQLDVQKD